MNRPLIAPASLGLLSLLVADHAVAASDIEVVPVLQNGTPSPDGNGFFESTILSPTVNENGEVAVSARLSGTFNGNLDDEVLLVVAPDGTISLRGRESDPAPDGDGVYGSLFPSNPYVAVFSQPAIGDQGALSVAKADFVQGTQGFSSGVVTGSSAPLNVIVREGKPMPGTGLIASQLLVGFIAGNSAGQAAIVMDTMDVSGTIRRGVWRVSNTEMTPVLQVGDPSPDGNGQVVSFHEGWVSINERGDVTLVAGLTPSGVFADPDGAVIAFVDGVAQVLAREGEPAIGGGSYGNFDLTAGNTRPVINDGSRVTFRSPLAGGSGIFQWNPATGMKLLLRTGQPSPDGQGTLLGFLNPVVTANNTVGVLTVHAWQAGVGSDISLLLGDGDSGFEVVVRTGQSFPGGGATIGNSVSMPHVNSSGTMAWVASDGSSSVFGLFLKRRGEPAQEIARSGAIFDGKPLEIPQVPPIPDPGNGKALNESDELVFVAFFQDGTQGIYRARPCADSNLGLPCVPLDANAHAISQGSGGSQTLLLDAGPTRAGRPYLLLSTLSGTWPGQSFVGTTIPLNPDPWFLFTLANPNTPFLPNSLGVLDAQGKRTTAFQLPPVPIPSLVGTLMHHAFVVANAAGTSVELASNAVPLTLVQ